MIVLFLEMLIKISENDITFNIPLGILGLQPETAVTGFVSHSVGAVLIDLIDLLHNDDRGLSGGSGGRGGR